MMYVKFAVLDQPNTVELEKYLVKALDSIQFESTIEGQDDWYKVHLETARDCKEFLRRVLEDYATLGYETETELDLFDLSVYCSDPELNNFFIHQRMNINQVSSEALSEIIVETSNEVARLENLVDRMEANATLNGLYKMRQILGVISSRLDEKGIHIGEEINAAAMQTVH